MIVETSVKLQPCPFCGGEAVLERLARGSKMLHITCAKCHVETPYLSTGEQIYCRTAGAFFTEVDVISRLCFRWNCRVL